MTLTGPRYTPRLGRVLPATAWRLNALLLILALPVLAAEERPTLALQPGAARPGDPVLVTVRGLAAQPVGMLGTRTLRFYPVPGGYQALTALAVEQSPGELEVKAVGPLTPGAPPVELSGTLEVVPPGWARRKLSVSTRFTRAPSAQIRARMQEDKAAFAAAFSQPFSPPLFQANFAWPRLAPITAPFGDLRLFNNRKPSQHYGTDLDGRTGDPVHAANAGTIVLVRDAYTSGHTVLIHHGASLYTAYFHLSKTLVRQGQQVKQGERLGLVGSTGRVTGPHLHWGVKVEDIWVDGETLLKLDFFPQ